jgi:predicted DNA-binding transcriptional regulator AlpA
MIANIFGRAPHPYKMSMVIVIEPDERPEPPLEPIGQDLNRSRLRAPKTDSDFERLLTPKETAQFLRVSESWLAKARMRGDGPPYLLFGRSIRYGGGGLVRWMKSCVRQSTSER